MRILDVFYKSKMAVFLILFILLGMIIEAEASSPEKEMPQEFFENSCQVDKRSDNFGIYYEKKELDADNVKYILTLLAHNPNASKASYNQDDVSFYGTIEIGQDDHFRLKAYFLCSPKSFLDKDLRVIASNKTNMGQGQVTFITSFRVTNSILESQTLHYLTLTVEDMRCALKSQTPDGMLKIDHKSVDYSLGEEEEKSQEKQPDASSLKKKSSSFSRMTSAIASYLPSPTFSRKNTKGTDLSPPLPKKDVKKGEKEASQPTRESQSFRLPKKVSNQGMSSSPIHKKQIPSPDCSEQNRKRSKTSPQAGRDVSSMGEEKKEKKSARRSQSFRLPARGKKVDISLSPVLKGKQNHWFGGKRAQKNKSPIQELHKPIKSGFSKPVHKAIDPCDVSKTIQYFEKIHQNAQKD